MFLLVIWRLLEAAFGHRDEDGGSRLRKRLVSLGKAVIYGVVGAQRREGRDRLRHSRRSGGTDRHDGDDHGLAGRPADRGRRRPGDHRRTAPTWSAAAWTEKFREHLDAEGQSGEAGQAYIWFGKAGYSAKGVAFAIVGGLFVYAAVTHDAKKSGGLDQALHKVLQQPFGQLLLGADRGRHRLLRPVLLRPGAAPVPLSPRPARSGPA